MFSSLRSRLWLSYAALIVTALTIVAIVLLVFLLRNPYLYRQAALRLSVADVVLRRTPLTENQITSVAGAFGVRALVLGSDGASILDSQGGAAAIRLTNLGLAPRVLGTIRDQGGRMWLYALSRRADGLWLMVATPRPGLVPVLTVVTDELARPLIQGGLIALLLALVLAYALARWIGDPLQRLIGATRALSSTAVPREMQSGDRDRGPTSVPEGGPHEVRELTRAFNAMAARVQASQRSQRELVANVSHELKTPLTSIQGYAQALLEGAADTPNERKHAAEVIHAEAARMHRMVVELLDLARMDAGTAELEMTAVDIGAVLRGAAERFKPLAQDAGIDLELQLADGLPNIAGDGDRLSQVFMNLLDNALKFTPRGGRIQIGAAAKTDGVQVSVADNGTGIAEKDIPHVFDRFYQADTARAGGEMHGAGLGLAIARQIVSAHSGRITVRSASGRGTEFTVQLPVHGKTGKT